MSVKAVNVEKNNTRYFKSVNTKAVCKVRDSPYYSESEICAGAVTVSFSKYLP